MDCVEGALRDYFARYGRVEEASVSRLEGSGRSRGFGFVTFDSPEAVEEVLRHYKNHHMEGQWVEVKRFGDKSARGPRGGGKGGGKGGSKGGSKGGYSSDGRRG